MRPKGPAEEKQRCTRCSVLKPLSAFSHQNGKPRKRCSPCEYARRLELERARNVRPAARGAFDITELLTVWPLGTPLEPEGEPVRVVEFGWKEPA